MALKLLSNFYLRANKDTNKVDNPQLNCEVPRKEVIKRIEEAFGWIKTVCRQEKTKLRGRDRVGWAFTLAAAAYNLVWWLPKLLVAPT